jgi:transposase
MTTEAVIREKYRALAPILNERQRRLWAGTEARQLGFGGKTIVIRATGLSYPTVVRGMNEAVQAPKVPPHRVRKEGGGRKPTVGVDPALRLALESLVEPLTRGDPESPLRWTCKSTRHLARELKARGYEISHATVAALLQDLGYSLQANRKTREGAQHPDRNAQFEYLNQQTRKALAAGQPAISVDTKKKELVGNFKNGGREWRPKGQPEPVRVHDFIDPQKGRAIPYGVYDLARNAGWVSVGIDHDTAAFAVASIARWWKKMGRRAYPQARRLLITADSGGSNGSRVRLWKRELQRLANRTGLTMTVCHFPPGTSKWNQIEHRLFSFIGQNWRGRPLLTHATIVNLIAGTHNEKGLKVKCEMDRRSYPQKIKVSDAQMSAIRLVPHSFHGEWNYTIKPVRR